MNLIPNIGLDTGLGSIRLGISPDELLRLFPEEQKYEDWMGGNLNDSLLFHGIIFSFDKCNSYGPLPNSRLNQIEVSGREDVFLWGKLIGDWNKAALLQYLNENKIRYEIFKSDSLSINSLSLWLTFGEQEQLISVTM